MVQYEIKQVSWGNIYTFETVVDLNMFLVSFKETLSSSSLYREITWERTANRSGGPAGGTQDTHINPYSTRSDSTGQSPLYIIIYFHYRSNIPSNSFCEAALSLSTLIPSSCCCTKPWVSRVTSIEIPRQSYTLQQVYIYGNNGKSKDKIPAKISGCYNFKYKKSHHRAYI
jgi:hypothetical protein